MNVYDFSGKSVVVTGGAQGIGRAIAQAFLCASAFVFVWDVDEEALGELSKEWNQWNGRYALIACDVASPEDVKRATEEIQKLQGYVDVLVNNAGIFIAKPLEALTENEWDRVLGVNLKSIFLTTKHLLPLFRKGGAIINIASTRALMSEPDTEAYAASKGGVLAITHALAISLSRRSIRVNAISPGWIETSLWKKRTMRKNPELRPTDHLQHPAGRVGIPEDIAEACLFLASPSAGFITGTNLVIDGGMTVKMIYAP
ncbi:MAG: SDR family oxidoreductase [Candidatus Caldatribacterium sp.]|uniref:glucose 1-dehydrogenase n=1 Tax=Candidatus Caldatribacterium sp. TaxID=2282143 RepID=UPI00299CA6E6|nr:SDR family oxidoreductase [Candidatus Caldatribacterium sp.]MCX7731062.1 SDR family oxidoreductase [Candidatus Caldatribacterium sp.]MDW8081233.1 SDR family oxidoreductase [Candidatus Calescibacterium sp.]